MFNHIYTPDKEFIKLALNVENLKQRNKKAIIQAGENKMCREKKYS